MKALWDISTLNILIKILLFFFYHITVIMTRSISYDDANKKIFFKNINIGNDDDSSEGPLSSLLFVWENVS